MALTYNNTVVNNVTYNGNVVDYVRYNGTLVWSRSSSTADIELSFTESSRTTIDVESNELDISGITDSVTITTAVPPTVISVDGKSSYAYDSTYVNDTTVFELKTNYTLTGVVQTIDSGNMEKVTVDRTLFNTVYEIEVT